MLVNRRKRIDMAFFDTDFYTNSYHPKESLSESEVKPPKCISAEDGIIATNKTNTELLDELCNENTKLRKKLKKARKKKEKWKHKYLELYNLVETMNSKNIWETEDSTMDRIKAGLGIPPIR
jgi:predicted nuclease with TOPRIM domain